VDVQIAPIATIGAKHGLPCPAVRALVAMTHECEAGTRPMSDANLTELLP
jgi:2-dehydropantoate 2-reductase